MNIELFYAHTEQKWRDLDQKKKLSLNLAKHPSFAHPELYEFRFRDQQLYSNLHRLIFLSKYKISNHVRKHFLTTIVNFFINKIEKKLHLKAKKN